VQQTDYYPYGLVARNFVRAGEKETLELFQEAGLQGGYEELTGWYDFHARQYDAALGRWFGVDPQDQFASPYLAMEDRTLRISPMERFSEGPGCRGAPVMMVDPDGEFVQFLVPMIIGAYANVLFQGMSGDIDNPWQMLGFAAVGALSGIMGGMSPSGILPGMAFGAASGASIGVLNSAISGGNMGQAALWGGISGGVMGGLFGGIKSVNEYRTLFGGKYKPLEFKDSDLSFDITSVTGDALPSNDTYLNDYNKLKFGSDYKTKFGVREMTSQHVPVGYEFDNSSWAFVNSKGEQVLGLANRIEGNFLIFISLKGLLLTRGSFSKRHATSLSMPTITI